MLRVKYCLYNGQQPQDTIIATIPGLTRNDLYMGRFFQVEGSDDCFYGEINTDSGNHANIISACSNWNMVQLNDQQAIDFANASGQPVGTQISFPEYVHSAAIEGGHVTKKTGATPPA